jgi:hypothetical protein
MEANKAEELLRKFYIVDNGSIRYNRMTTDVAKECAIIALNELIEYAKTFGDVTISDVEEFEKRKTEIENI